MSSPRPRASTGHSRARRAQRAPGGTTTLATEVAASLERLLGPVDEPAGRPRRCLVAFSGGADSLALLLALVELRAQRSRGRPLLLRAVHVDHQLQASAAAWARHCRRQCRALGVPLTVRRVTVRRARGASPEAAARNARYAALERELRSGELLLTAHHLDDQLETLLLQLLRGAGVAGLAAMPGRAAFGRGLLLRPLLGLRRARLLEAVGAAALEWVEDPSNAELRFDRNYLRHEVVPRLQARWPAAAAAAARSAAHLADARELLADLASLDLPALARGQALDGDALGRLSGPRQRNAVRAWLGRLGLPLPDSVHLERIIGELRAARGDAAPVVCWPGAEVRRYRGQLHAMPPLAPPPSASLRWDLRRSRRCTLGGGLGELVLVPDPHGPLSRGALPRVLEVGFRVGGERLQLADGGPRRRLKEWLRAQAVLPWMRTRLPLLRAAADGALVAVADLAVAAPYARRDARDGCRIEWRGAPAVRTTLRPAAAHNDPRLLRTCDSS